MKGAARKGGKKNRKHGRVKDRSPAHARYNAENRREKNKRARATTRADKLARKAESRASAGS